MDNNQYEFPIYNNYSRHLRDKYQGQKVYKVIVDAGFTCPNRDGSKGFGGCTYCNVDSFTPQLTRSLATIGEQIAGNVERMRKMYNADKFILYYQPNTNTYGTTEQVQKVIDEGLKYIGNDFVGLSIGTRADCLDEEKLQLMELYTDRLDVDLEIGMESMYNDTLKAINRGHTHEEFLATLEQCRDRKFEVSVHTIFGFPGETLDMQLAVANQLNELPIKYAKLHHLYVVKGSIMGVKYLRNPWPLYSLETYADFLCEFIPLLRPDLVLQRLYGISDPEYHIAPSWGKNRRQIQSYLEKTLAERGAIQGSKYRAKNNIHETTNFSL